MNVMVLALVANLVLAHLIGDFFLQTKWMLEGKRHRQFRFVGLYVHALVMGLVSWVASGALDFWWYALFIGLSHVVFDGIKGYLHAKPFWPLVTDQLAHLVVIVGMTLMYAQHHAWMQCSFVSAPYAASLPMGLGAVVFLTRPANLIVQELFEWNRTRSSSLSSTSASVGVFDFSKDDDEKSRRMQNAGCWIGAFERVLTFVFVVIGCYQAVGFIMAAKSILRFKESDGPRAEYVLVGTLVSVTIAVLFALLMKMLSRVYVM